MSTITDDATTTTPAILHYVIPEEVILAEETRIEMALIMGGYDPQELPLRPVAVEAKLLDLREKALFHGIPISGRTWTLNDQGDAEVVFSFEEVTHAVLFKVCAL